MPSGVGYVAIGPVSVSCNKRAAACVGEQLSTAQLWHWKGSDSPRGGGGTAIHITYHKCAHTHTHTHARTGTLVTKSLMTAVSGPLTVASAGNALVSLDVFALQASGE